MTAGSPRSYTGATPGETAKEVSREAYPGLCRGRLRYRAPSFRPSPRGKCPRRRRSSRLTPEQMAEEIAAWQKQLEAPENDIRDPTKIWVKLEPGYDVPLEEEEVADQIKRLWLLDFFCRSSWDKKFGFERAMWTEQRIIVEMDAAFKATYNELMKQDRAIREEKEQLAQRLREIIQGLEWKRLSAITARSQAADAPPSSRTKPPCPIQRKRPLKGTSSRSASGRNGTSGTTAMFWAISIKR
ncbi:MAG: hypothetical protein MZV70_70575 [Desulfobacterales bacterium]|nr:hypothetical protein [Desulfobacterales bacterium]